MGRLRATGCSGAPKREVRLILNSPYFLFLSRQLFFNEVRRSERVVPLLSHTGTLQSVDDFSVAGQTSTPAVFKVATC